jgi:hypothetical protein
MMTSISEFESRLLSLLNGKCTSLRITYNDHMLCHDEFKDEIDFLPYYDPEHFVSVEDRQKCLDENKLWIVHWYPISSDISRHVMASSLELALTKVFEIGKC